MSFDVFLQAFANGDSSDADPQLLLALIEPRVARSEEDADFALLSFSDGEADLYGIGSLRDGFMVNHISGRAAWDFFVDLADRAGLAILPGDCPTAVTREELVAHLPEELQDDVVVVKSGSELLDVIEGTAPSTDANADEPKTRRRWFGRRP